MVFRRDNKVDSFQRQMSALRNQLGNTGAEQDELADDMPELDDDQYGADSYRAAAGDLEEDSGAYSFGTYPSQSGQGLAAQGREGAPAVPEMPQADGSVSVVARDTSWKGDITSETSVHVFGKVEGNITAREDIWIAEGAELDATITAQRVIVAGTVAGTVNASGRFEALPTGRITADVSSPVSVVHEGATINGQFRVGANGAGTESRTDRASSASVIQRRARTAS